MTTESLRAFAARKGNAVSYWHGQKARGRLVMVDVGGKQLVDVEASEALLASTADPAKSHMAEVNDRQRMAAAPQAPARPPQVPEFQPGGGHGASKSATYMQAKTAREVYEAKTAQLEYEERTGKLIQVSAVRATWATRIASARDALLQIPARIAPVLAAETNLAAVTLLLEDEIRQALAELIREDAGT
ncbi:MAG: hypothetical protein KA757_11605 [Vogesella sp.]|nr:hypothetical protein [Vogesella sp.]